MNLGEVLQSIGVVAGFLGLICVCSDPKGPVPIWALVGLLLVALAFILRSDQPSPWRWRR